ncbi:hypothetical protein VCHA34P116_250046 [Vibrio chagasii]|nr:hypothetical protein VCHA34P116_250046 [Vibrio chagasii]CAH6877306.1 hypothetical protein VCHA32P90_250046 [Vibrio chagasii]CAH6878451.1 hypothetical protein VCHA35O137_240012 [Vibrio chagasii]CAH7161812.1 hypothetical protein VCHA39P230_250012 [Vibrio chagasii]CAH7176550.1 hypothetical protein VCHA37P194_230012 [Vibrio chagasii]
MIDFPILPLLAELGLKPAEILILGLLWQNIKNTNVLMGKLIKKVNELEFKLNNLYQS